jgi:4-amino-4-deoxy-L-arabinose transferase-like glycosyltransferase
MFNTKPPFVIWFMVLSSKVLGFSELSVRLPNAIAGVFICLLLYFFAARVLNSSMAAFLSVLTLISSTGFITMHIIRSGEYDAFLTLFTLIFCICFFMLLESPSPEKKLWLGITLALTCAILTKGVAALLTLPGLLIYAIVQKKLFWLIRSKEIYISAVFIMFFGLGYYVLREHFNPGYLHAISENELAGRYIKHNAEDSSGFGYYWNLLNSAQFSFVMPVVLIGIFSTFFNPNKGRSERLVWFSSCVVVPFIFVLSLSSTKNTWYDAPAAPFIALIAGFGFIKVLDFLFKKQGEALSRSKVLMRVAFVALILGPAYGNVIANNLNMVDFEWNKKYYTVPYYIKKKEGQNANLDGYKVIYDPYLFRSQMCQIKELQNKGQKIEIVYISALKEGDKVITEDPGVRNEITKSYSYTELDSLANVKAWILTAKVIQ